MGGVILFARNFESRAQLTRLTRQIHKARREPLLILVDHEGGRVQRFRETVSRRCRRCARWASCGTAIR